MKYSIIKLLCISLLLANCSKSESNNEQIPEDLETEQSCLIKEIRFATSKYEYIYNNNNELRQIINTYNDNPTTYYVNQITNDSINIGIILDDLSQDFPTISSKYDGKKLIQIKRFYNPSKLNIFNFEYAEGKITVRQDYSSGTSYQNVNYGDYFINQDGNVTSAKLYKYDNNSPNNFTLFKESNYTYDSGNNTWKGIVYPTFLCQNLPDAMWFSQNNVISETNNNYYNNTSTNYYYSYEYDENNLTTKGLNKYPYNVCGSAITLDEYYSYTNCYDY
jgi:hypothetical protein